MTETTKTEEESPELDPAAAAAIRSGSRLYNEGKLVEAEVELAKAAQLAPDNFEALYNHGVVLRDLERLDESETSLLAARKANPKQSAQVDNNLGVISARRGQYEKSIEFYRQAIDREFQFAQAHLNLAFSLLKLGRFEEGWKEHEWRWETSGFTPIRCLQPRWNGQPIPGNILVHTEQGAGDTFQFMRLLPQVRQRCNQLILVLPERLRCMFHGDWADELMQPGTLPMNRFQAILPLMSAPHALGIGDQAFGSLVPYLTPAPRTVELGTPHVADARLKVGLAWGGSVTHANDRHRSVPLEKLRPILEVPQVAFYSLQKGPQVAEIAALNHPALRDTDQLQQDFADTAAIMQQLDLVLSIDTSVLHLAGGLGLPAWALLCERSDWRWLMDRDDMDWYPTMLLFRQQQLGEWDELAQRVASELRGVLAGTSELPRRVTR